MHRLWLYLDTEQEYYSEQGVNCKMTEDAGKNENLWSVKTKEQCGQIVHKEIRGRQSSDECGTLRQRRGKQFVFLHCYF